MAMAAALSGKAAAAATTAAAIATAATMMTMAMARGMADAAPQKKAQTGHSATGWRAAAEEKAETDEGGAR